MNKDHNRNYKWEKLIKNIVYILHTLNECN